MKKFVVLMLVLGMASLANAALTWSIAGSTAADNPGAPGFEVNKLDVITLTLSASGATLAEKVNAVKVDLITDNGAPGGITNVVCAVSAWVSAGNGADGMDAAAFGALIEDPSFAAGDWAAYDRFGTGDASTGALMIISYNVGNAAANVTINGAGIPLLENNNYILMGSQQSVPMPSILLNVVPEPATLAILGLGALLLRRK